MLQRGQIFVRAKVGDKWESVDILDLDEESRWVFLWDLLRRAGLLYAIKSTEDAIELRVKDPSSSEPPSTPLP